MGKLLAKSIAPKYIKVKFTLKDAFNARDFQPQKYPTHREFVEELFKKKGYKVIAHIELKYFPLKFRSDLYGYLVEGAVGTAVLSL